MTYHLFEVTGVELEYMIVDAESLDVSPIADQLIHHACGSYASDVDRGTISWSNELARHVIELKTTEPTTSLTNLHDAFHQQVHDINHHLQSLNALLLPTAMHPWMQPDEEFQVWPHDYNETYEAFNEIFDCRGHGWSNLQSMHLNLPFANDHEFARLHAAIRLVLPILPAIAASSPFMEGNSTEFLDNRLEVYRTNARRIPQVTGDVIPEPVYSHADYETQILQPLYQAISPFDTDAILQHEWLNARGAIARFERNAIEIRVLDLQECPRADLGIAQLVVALLKQLASVDQHAFEQQKAFPTDRLAAIFRRVIRTADRTVIDDVEYLRLFGICGTELSASELWHNLLQTLKPQSTWSDEEERTIRQMVDRGCLARQLLNSSHHLVRTYRRLAECLAQNSLYA
ncbi:MAG: glutamate-cysteine ligase family protein [Pirellulaceae bacterium]